MIREVRAIVRDFAFYNAGVDDATGPRRAVAMARRLLRRLLRPIFFRQEAIYRDLQGQIDALEGQLRALDARVEATDAFGWDHVAMARRLAAIEDRLDAGSPEADRGPVPGRRLDGASNLPAPHATAPAFVAARPRSD